MLNALLSDSQISDWAQRVVANGQYMQAKKRDAFKAAGFNSTDEILAEMALEAEKRCGSRITDSDHASFNVRIIKLWYDCADTSTRSPTRETSPDRSDQRLT